MTGAITAALILLAYATGFLTFARRRYARTRPYTEPLSCTTPLSCRLHGHDRSCWRREGCDLTDTTTEALVYALMLAVIWPVVTLGTILVAVMRPVITSGARETQAERDAKIARLERDTGIKP